MWHPDRRQLRAPFTFDTKKHSFSELGCPGSNFNCKACLRVHSEQPANRRYSPPAVPGGQAQPGRAQAAAGGAVGTERPWKTASDVAGGPRRSKRTGDENLPPVRLIYMTCTTAVPLNVRAVVNRALEEYALDS